MQRWLIRNPKTDINKVSEELNVSIPTAYILANRGIKTKNDAQSFLHPNLSALHSIKLMKDVDKAVYLLVEAIQKKHKIIVYGDYDVDGVMSTVIIYKVLKHVGAVVDYYIPHRSHEGYGLNCNAVKKFKEDNVDLILTCDNGISAMEEIKLAKHLNISVIVIDHHEQGQSIPCADAVIDPKQNDCTYPFKLLCAAGICFKFAKHLCKILNKTFDVKDYLIFAAIATVCDIVDLTDENRILVKKGLELINDTDNIGLKALLNQTKLTNKKIEAYHIGFILGPCINAAGRLESANIALRLFITEDLQEADKIAKKLAELNKLRKEMTINAVDKLLNQKDINENDRVLVLYNPDIHESIAGIVAGRIKESLYKPTIVITKGEHFEKGSGRSIDGYNMFAELYKYKELFIKFGGHPMAAGLSIENENITMLRKLLNENCSLTDEDLIQKVYIDMRIPIKKINLILAKELQIIEPFGRANPEPLFAEKNINIKKIDFLGSKKEVIKFTIIDDMNYLTAISFDGYNKFKTLIKSNFSESEYKKIMFGGSVDLNMDLLFTININEYNNTQSVQLIIKDFRLSE